MPTVSKSPPADPAAALGACQLFASVSPEDLAVIAGFAIPQRLARGEYLYREGDASYGFFVVQKGAINLHRLSPSGKEQVIHIFRANEVFAEATVSSEGGYLTDARAIEPSSVLLIPRNDFTALLRRRPALALQMLASMSHYLSRVMELLADLTLKDVETRLVHRFLKQCPRPLSEEPVTFRIERNKRALAAEIGTVSATLSRTLAKLRRQKLIRVEGRSITVLHPLRLDAALRRLLGEG